MLITMDWSVPSRIEKNLVIKITLMKNATMVSCVDLVAIDRWSHFIRIVELSLSLIETEFEINKIAAGLTRLRRLLINLQFLNEAGVCINCE